MFGGTNSVSLVIPDDDASADRASCGACDEVDCGSEPVHAGPAQMDTELEILVLQKSRGRVSMVGRGKTRDVRHGRRLYHVFWGEGQNRRSCGGRPRSVQASGDHMWGGARVGD